MSWLGELHDELGRAGIRGGARRRIELELADHLACDPGAEGRLGAPKDVAEAFAAELCVVRTRRAAAVAFAALAVAAAGVLATLASYRASGGWREVPGARGWLVFASGLVVLFAPQVAIVAGCLGAVRGYRVRHGARDAELALVQRRMHVAVAAAAVTSAALLVDACALWSLMPAWWGPMALGCVLLPAAALACAGASLRGAAAVTPGDSAGAPGLEADVPAPLRPYAAVVVARPLALLAVVGVPVCLAALAVTAHAERSLLEGVERMLAEGLVLTASFVALGRRLGLRR